MSSHTQTPPVPESRDQALERPSPDFLPGRDGRTKLPTVAWGLKSQTVALKARTGQLRDRDVIDFLADTLELMRDRTDAVGAAVMFARNYLLARDGAGRAEAGEDLYRFLGWWTAGTADADRRAQDAALADAAATSGDWRERADAGL